MKARQLRADDLTWYAILVEPQRELAVTNDLEERHVEAYCPIRTAWVRRGRNRNARFERAYPLISRYVFVGWLSTPNWSVVCDVDHVIGPVGYEGEPYRIRPREIQSLMDREAKGAWRAPVWHRSLRKGEAIDIDTRVRVVSRTDSEQLTDQIYRILGVEGGQARIVPDVPEDELKRLGIFGAVPIKAPLDRLRRAS
jgi:transcription antitermination factor NusG